MSLAPRTHVKVIYEGVDISRDVSKDLLSLSYVDNEGGKADDIRLKLKNNHGYWSDPWLPAKGDTVTVFIITESDQGVKELNCGSCQIDTIRFSGPPSIVDLSGMSVPFNTTIRRTKKSRAWESVRLSEIASDIAEAGGVELVFQPNPAGADEQNTNPIYDRRDQREEADLAFLKRLCDDEGFSLKLTDRQLVIYDQSIMEFQPPSVHFELGENNILSFEFETQASDIYKKAIVQYKDPAEGVVNTFEYIDPAIQSGQELRIVRRTESPEEAERIAKAELKKKNRLETTAKLSVVGRVDLVSGVTVTLGGFGKFSGKYYVQKSEHKVENGYTTTMDLSFVGDH